MHPMQYHSTKDKSCRTNFENALLTGIAPDGGLFVPEKIPTIISGNDVNHRLREVSFSELAFEIARHFVDGEISDPDLRKICEDAYNFEIPLVEIADNHSVLELFHGPTAAFKDFAARFMARCASYFLAKNSAEKIILVATSGDTGGAVGNGFLGLPGVRVFILYPRGGISQVQEQQLTTMGKNVQAVEIDGNFDDCQRLVKEAFVDKELNQKLDLMSANSINVGRVIPQSFYYAWVALTLSQKQKVESQKDQKIVFSVPSGNFGNLTGGLLAQMMGFPIHKFIAANNANHPFVDFLESGNFEPAPSVPTISNAMDIGHPNNFYRINYFFGEDISEVRDHIWGAWFDDTQTREMIKRSFDRGYLACPHTAVALLGTKKFREKFGDDFYFVTVSTAHPAKFPEVVEEIIGQKIKIPENIQAVLKKKKEAQLLDPVLEALRDFLIKN